MEKKGFKIGHACLKILLFLTLLVYITACSEMRNIDSNSSNNCGASECHPSTPLNISIPDTGKHTIHLEKGSTCDNCHNDYMDNRNHKNRRIA